MGWFSYQFTKAPVTTRQYKQTKKAKERIEGAKEREKGVFWNCYGRNQEGASHKSGARMRWGKPEDFIVLGQVPWMRIPSYRFGRSQEQHLEGRKWGKQDWAEGEILMWYGCSRSLRVSRPTGSPSALSHIDALYPHINQSLAMGYPWEGQSKSALLRTIPRWTNMPNN